MIDSNTIWNSNIGKWQIPFLSMAGNKIRKRYPEYDGPKKLSRSDIKRVSF